MLELLGSIAAIILLIFKLLYKKKSRRAILLDNLEDEFEKRDKARKEGIKDLSKNDYDNIKFLRSLLPKKKNRDFTKWLSYSWKRRI